MARSENLQERDFERLFEEHAQPLFGFLVYRTADRALAEDILAATFERALRARRRFDRRRGSEKNWLYSIALNLLRDHLRKREAEARAIASIEVDQEPVDYSASVANRELAMQALSALSPEEREAVALRYGADLTVPEIAKLIGEPITTVEGRVYPALRKMREVLIPGTDRKPAATSARTR
jgi:RNA polymerase sigma factor (sigma-70 family)